MATQAALLQIQVDVIRGGKARRELQAIDKDFKGVDATSRRAAGGIDKFSSSAGQVKRPVDDVNSRLLNLNQSFLGLSNAMKLVKWPVILSAVGPAAKGVSALAAGTTSLVGALIPAAGAATGAAAAYGAMGQAAGVIALSGVKDLTGAVGGLNEKLDKSSEAYKALSPQAQKFAQELELAKEPLRDLQRGFQTRLFKGMDVGLEGAMQALDALRPALNETASILGKAAERAGKFVSRDAFGADLTKIAGGNNKVLRRMTMVAFNLADAFRHVTVEAQPLIDWMSEAIVNFSRYIKQSAKAGRETGDLAEFFEETKTILKIVVPAIGDFAKGLWNVLRVGSDLGTKVWRALAGSAEEFRKWTESAKGQNAIKQWFEDARRPLWEMGRLVRDVGEAFFDISSGRGSGLTKMIRQIRTELLPVFVDVTKNAEGFGPIFLDFVTEASKAMKPFLGPSGPLTLLAKAATTILRGFNGLLEAVPELGTVLATFLGARTVSKLLNLGSVFGGGGLIGGLFGGGKGKGGFSAMGLASQAKTTGQKIGSGLKAGLKASGVFAAVSAGFSFLADPGAMGGRGRLMNVAAGFGLGPSAEEKQAEHIADLRDQIQGAGDDWGKLHEVIQRINLAQAIGDISEDAGQQLRNMTFKAQDAASKTAYILKSKLIRDGLEHSWSDKWKNIAGISDKNLDRIQDLLETKPKKGVEALNRAMGRMVESIRKAMKDGEISTRAGQKKIHSLLIDQLGNYGISHGGAQKIIKAKQDGGQGGFQRGGLLPGVGTGDSIPVMAEPGEGFINRTAVKALGGKRGIDAINSRFPRFAKGGMAGGLNFALGPYNIPPIQYAADHAGTNSHVHVTGTNTPWTVAMGRKFQQMGWSVGEHPAFGGVAPPPTHSLTGGHYDGLAFDANTAQDETKAQVAAVAAVLGGAGAGAGLLGKLKLKLPRFDSPFSMFTPHARGLNQTSRGLEKIIGRRAQQAPVGAGIAPTGGGALSKSQLVSLWNRTGKGGDANLMAAIALAESGGNPAVTNSIGARGLWQIIPSTARAFGLNYAKLTNPVLNAKGAHAILSGQGLGAWEAYTNGAYSQYLQRGGVVGMQGGGIPGAPPGFGMGRFGRSHQRQAQIPVLFKRIRRMMGKVARTDERIQIAETMAGLATSPGGSDLAAVEKTKQIGLQEFLLGQLGKVGQMASLGARLSRRFGKSPSRFVEVEREMKGVTGRGGRIFDAKVALSELKATPAAGTQGLSIDQLLSLREAFDQGIFPVGHSGGRFVAPAGQSQGAAILQQGETVTPDGATTIIYSDVYFGSELVAEKVRHEIREVQLDTHRAAKTGRLPS